MSKFGEFLQRNEASIVGAGTGLLGGLFSIGARKKAFKRSKELMNKQFNMDKQMWDYQNAYNTPVRQMQRLKDAGLNPALMYGQGTTGNANNMVQSKFTELSPYTSATDIAQSTAAGVQMSMMNAQKKLAESQAYKNTIDGLYRTKDYELAKTMNEQQVASLSASEDETRQRIENLKAEKGLTDAKVTSEKTINDLNNEYLKLERAGMHKGNILATVFKGVFGLDMKNENDRLIAQGIIGAYLGADVFGKLTGGLKNLLFAVKK